MKSLLIVSVLLLAHQVYSAPPPFVAKCMEENGVTKEDAMAFVEKGEASDKMKCNMKCVMMASGAMSEDGKLVLDPMLKKAPSELHDTLKACMDSEVDSDMCVTAYNHNKCLRDKDPEFFKKMHEAMSSA